MTEHEKLREAIKRIKARATACAVPVPQWAEDEYLVACAAESTLPKTKMVEVWRVEYASRMTSGKWQVNADHYWTQDTAETRASIYAADERIACIRVTGPHQQEVPCA